SSTDPLASFECRLDGVAWLPCSSPQAFSGLADGQHSFEVRARDLLGNVDSSPAIRTWTVDTAGPDTAIDSGPSGTTTTASASFGFSSGDSSAGFECRLDGGGWSSCSSPKPYSGLADGAHTFDVRAKDGAGNVDPTP